MFPWTVALSFLCPWNSPGKNPGVGSHSLLQGIFLIQRLNLGCLHSLLSESSEKPASLVAQLGENPPAMQETRLIPGSGRFPGEEMGYPLQYSWASLVAQTVKIRLQFERPGFDYWFGKIPWRSIWQPTPLFLPGESPWTVAPAGLQRVGHS